MSLGIDTDHKLTPMMEQYRSVKRSLAPDTLLFFRMGDFYEMFFEDAVRASDILNITLTGREAGKAGRVPMCGIPYHSVQGYLKTLVDNNLKVAICEQIGDPKASKGLVQRKVTRVVSPATFLEDEGASQRQFSYMVSVVKDGEQCALACLELSTGEFYVREIPSERLLGELTLIRPREVILPHSLGANDALTTFVEREVDASLTRYDDWVFGAEEGLRLLQEGFELASERAIEFHDHPLAVRAAGAILYYLKDHFHSAWGHVQQPSLLETTDFMVLDRQTQKSLELVQSLNGDKRGPTLLKTIDQTVTSMGARTLYRWLTHPLLSVLEITQRQDAVQELVEKSDALNGIRALITGVKDVERTLSRLNYGVANARDLENLKLFLERVPELQEKVQTFRSSALVSLQKHVRPFPELHDLLARAIVEEPPLSVKEGNIIRDGFSENLDELRMIAQQGKSWLLEFEKREAERSGIKKLKIKYSQVFGYMIEVSKTNVSLVPDDYVRRQTLANAERYVTPELKEWDAKISGAQDKIKALEYELFNEVREEILQRLSDLQAIARAIGYLDALASLATVARQKTWVRPLIDEAGHLEIQDGRHPVVEAMLPVGEFVENDTALELEGRQMSLITGPNMAGKSTYIRQVALIVILAQIGSYVPARSARIGLVDRVFTRIGASDNLAQGESTFMVEMVEMAHILRKATPRSLLILDEVGRGTSTFDGVSIAWAICEFLAAGTVRPRTLFATHYHELTQLEGHFPGIQNLHVTVRERERGIVFLRKLARGGSDRSYGIHVAQLAGIPEKVIHRAGEILKVLESESIEATQIIEGHEERPKPLQRKQANLFDWSDQEHPIIEELKKLEINNMTALQALNQLAKWKEQLS